MTRDVALLRYIDRVEQGRFRLPKDPVVRGLVLYMDDCKYRGQWTVSTDELMAQYELLTMGR